MSELIDRQALKDAVRRYAGEPIKAKDKKCQAICLDMLGTIDAQPTASPWHRAEDELPKLPDKDYCHVWCVGWFEGQNTSVPMAYGRILKKGKRKERWLLYDRICLPPTKWAYLPEPPKEGE